MEPIYNPDGSKWKSKADYKLLFETKIKPILDEHKAERLKQEKRQQREDSILCFLVVATLLLHIYLDGYAVRHGQLPMFFGR
jgi:hypothetical protein